MTNTVRCEKCHGYYKEGQPCKMCAYMERRKKKADQRKAKEKEQELKQLEEEGTLDMQLYQKQFEEGVKFVTRSRLFKLAFWPFSKIHEDRLLKKSRRLMYQRYK